MPLHLHIIARVAPREGRHCLHAYWRADMAEYGIGCGDGSTAHAGRGAGKAVAGGSVARWS